MKKKFLEYYKSHKERTLIMAALLLTALTFLWIFEKPAEAVNSDGPAEMSLNIPKGLLVVPVELVNSKTMATMINRMGVIDVFAPGNRLIARNLRVLKLNNEENGSFGALVPEKQAAILQSIFAIRNLRGALKNMTSDAAQYFVREPSRAKIESYNVQE